MPASGLLPGWESPGVTGEPAEPGRVSSIRIPLGSLLTRLGMKRAQNGTT